jgi:hypothetical protein
MQRTAESVTARRTYDFAEHLDLRFWSYSQKTIARRILLTEAPFLSGAKKTGQVLPCPVNYYFCF